MAWRKNKRQVKCTMCTPHRWKGNKTGKDGRFKAREQAIRNATKKEAENYR